MTPLALTLVLAAAALHAGWNLMLKQASDRQLISWWSMLTGAILFLPLLAARWPLPAEIWPYVAASAAAEVAYVLFLGHAYAHGDFSLIYPIARGAAPAMLTLWAALFLGERPSAGGAAGLALVLLGLVAVGAGHAWAHRGAQRVSGAGVGLALGVAVMISIYSTIDAAAVRIADPAAYTVLVFAATGLLQAPLMLARSGARRSFGIWRAEWRRIAPIGALMLATYLLVLQAYATSTASYVGAVREVSIVLAALAGWRWLGEGFGWPRLVGAALTFCGILTIAALG